MFQKVLNRVGYYSLFSSFQTWLIYTDFRYIYTHKIKVKVTQNSKNLTETKQAQKQPKITPNITKNFDNLIQHCSNIQLPGQYPLEVLWDRYCSNWTTLFQFPSENPLLAKQRTAKL